MQFEINKKFHRSANGQRWFVTPGARAFDKAIYAGNFNACPLCGHTIGDTELKTVRHILTYHPKEVCLSVYQTRDKLCCL